MIKQNYGGNKIKYFELGDYGKQSLCTGPYEYYYYKLYANERIELSELKSFTVYIYSKDKNAEVVVNGWSDSLDVGDCIQAEGRPVILSCNGGIASILVAGTHDSNAKLENSIIRTKHNKIYKVVKPWGHELWLNGQHPCYALKEIYIKAGTKTSLQYHNFKQETNVLFSGSAKIHYKCNPDIKNDDVTSRHIATVLINPFTSVDVVPQTLHRVEAITDILLYETSTPHLDDVIRVIDDSNRAHGRLQSEHLDS